MTFDDLIRHYRFASRAAKALGVCRATIYNWRRNGIPAERIPEIERAMRVKARKR